MDWTKHTEHHWSLFLNGHKLDFWPSANKWQWKAKIYKGDVAQFIKNRINRK